VNVVALGLVLAVVGAVVGWYAARIADRVLLDRGEEDITAQPSWVAPVASLFTAVLFALIVVFIEPELMIVPYLAFVALTVTLFVTDVQARLIPDRINYPGTAAVAVLLLVGAVADGNASSLTRAAIGAAIYFLVTLALFVLGGGRSFGGGDVKLSVVLGLFTAFLGWDVLVAAIVLGFLIGGVAGVVLLVSRMRGLRDHFAFGPPMILGAYVSIAAGEELVRWYVG
jgi:leader peptidase (prepilin peptidase)/N-methyltransferase